MPFAACSYARVTITMLNMRAILVSFIAVLTATVLAVLAPASANPMSGGYQLFEPVALDHQADIQLASLENFDYHARIAPECCNAPNSVLPDGWRPVTGVGAQVNTPRGFTTYRTPDGDLVHVSPGGLQYGADPKFGNRVDHVLDHTAPNPNKPVHSVFNAQGDDALDLVDQAWARRGAPDPNDAAAFVVDMGRAIGTAGETSIRIVVRPGTTEVVTAYPY